MDNAARKFMADDFWIKQESSIQERQPPTLLPKPSRSLILEDSAWLAKATRKSTDHPFSDKANRGLPEETVTAKVENDMLSEPVTERLRSVEQESLSRKRPENLSRASVLVQVPSLGTAGDALIRKICSRQELEDTYVAPMEICRLVEVAENRWVIARQFDENNLNAARAQGSMQRPWSEVTEENDSWQRDGTRSFRSIASLRSRKAFGDVLDAVRRLIGRMGFRRERMGNEGDGVRDGAAYSPHGWNRREQ